MRAQPLALLLLSLACAVMPAQAAKWSTVARQEGERIEIDKARIARVGQGQTLAWSRLVLSQELSVDGKNYNAVEALNRYDCSNRRFTTLKRVYLRGVEPVKEEAIGATRQMSVDADSVDEKLMGEACKPRTVGEMKQTAEMARQAAAAASTASALPDEQPPARVMLADVRQLAETSQDTREKTGRIRTVSDSRGDATHKIELPHRSDLAAKAAAEKAALIPPETAAAGVSTHPAAAIPSVPAAGHSPAVVSVPPPLPAYRPAYRTISRGAPRHKPAAKASAEHVTESHAVHWSYEGEGSPANWSKLRADYALCASGQRQSPIDIRDGIRVDLEPLKLDYKPSQFRIVDNGHTIQASVGEGSSLSVMGREYTLVQFHFHRPAEERVNGKTYDMVVHLVHKDLDGRLAVIAVLLEKGNENPLIQTLWNNLPLEVGQELAPEVSIDLNQLLPDAANRAYWTYMGSLTTPPCTENVLWMVLKQPLQISAEQIAIFSRLYRHNARPIQSANNRLIKSSR